MTTAGSAAVACGQYASTPNGSTGSDDHSVRPRGGIGGVRPIRESKHSVVRRRLLLSPRIDASAQLRLLNPLPWTVKAVAL